MSSKVIENMSLDLALNELKHTTYWLDLIYETEVIAYEIFDNLHSEFSELGNGIKEAIKKEF